MKARALRRRREGERREEEKKKKDERKKRMRRKARYGNYSCMELYGILVWKFGTFVWIMYGNHSLSKLG